MLEIYLRRWKMTSNKHKIKFRKNQAHLLQPKSIRKLIKIRLIGQVWRMWHQNKQPKKKIWRALKLQFQQKRNHIQWRQILARHQNRHLRRVLPKANHPNKKAELLARAVQKRNQQNQKKNKSRFNRSNIVPSKNNLANTNSLVKNYSTPQKMIQRKKS